jgi:hypothetical protein
MKIPIIKFPEKKQMVIPIKTHYSKTLWCNNCGEINELKIPLGTTIIDFLQTYKCKECGCDWLKSRK